MGFTARNLFRDPPMSPYHKPFVALTWARARARRDKSKPEWTKERSVDKTAEEWCVFLVIRSLCRTTLSKARVGSRLIRNGRMRLFRSIRFYVGFGCWTGRSRVCSFRISSPRYLLLIHALPFICYISCGVERTLNWLTVSFFDWGEMEDRSTYSFMAMLHRILEQLNEHNDKHPEDPWQAPAHLWVSR